jgi:glycosyltransferase involved in cell wall biosynthesis
VSVARDDIVAGRGDASDANRRPLRTVAIGVSTGETCGVHDHAVLLAEALDREGVSCSLRWLWRTGGSIGTGRAEIGTWTRRLATELAEGRPDAVLLHYSVFAYSYRGLPLFVRPALSALQRSGIPLVTVLHEYAYPWRRGGVRGTAWALTQRAILFDVLRASTAAIVTAPFRVEWLRSRVWLPPRRTVVAPVFSNLPPPAATARPDGSPPVIGLFGYAAEGAAVSVVLDALRLLQDRGIHVRLALLGAPGAASVAGEVWLGAARRSGIARAPTFSGRLAAQDLSDALAECDILLSADPPGPTSRKTTLAASLASGRPVVAIDGPRSWPELIGSGAALIVEPTGTALASALAALLEDDDLRGALGARGRAFARRAMSVDRSAKVVGGLLRDVVGERPSEAWPASRSQGPDTMP